MAEVPHRTESLSAPHLAISRAVRFALAALVIGLSYPTIRCALHVDRFEQLYADMLGKRTLPAATTFLLEHRTLFVVLGVLWPLSAVLSIFLPGVSRPIYFSGCIVLCTFVQLFFQWHMLTAPLFIILQSMQG